MSGPESAMLGGRLAAEALMVDTCLITSPGSGEPTWDDEDGTYTEPERPVVYEGPCKVQRTALEPRQAEAGERTFAVEAARVDVPMAVVGVRIGQRVEILTAEYDPDLAGARFRVESIGAKTWATARRLRCSEGEATP